MWILAIENDGKAPNCEVYALVQKCGAVEFNRVTAGTTINFVDVTRAKFASAGTRFLIDERTNQCLSEGPSAACEVLSYPLNHNGGMLPQFDS